MKEWWEYYDMGCDDLDPEEEEKSEIIRDSIIENKINEEIEKRIEREKNDT